MPKFYTVKEVARIFCSSTYTIRRWIAEGDVFETVVKVKDGYLISDEEIQRLLKDS